MGITKFLRTGAVFSVLIAGLNSAVFAQKFVHPGGLHTQADLDRMKEKVAAGESPWIDGWNLLITDRKAQADYTAAPHRHMASRQRAQDDANAAYLNALRWVVSGDESHAECAVRILNAWAGGVTEIPRGNDQPGLSGIPVGTFSIAAEVLRTYSGWSVADQEVFRKLLLIYFYPVCHDFLVNHNGAHDTHYWANWDACNMRAILAIGVFCDDREKFDEAIGYYKYGKGMGAIRNAVPFLYSGGLGQWQESGRDQAHVMGGQGLLAEMCQIAWNQDVDLFGYDSNRLLAGAEYTAQYNLWKGVPYTFYNNAADARQCYVSENYHGRLDASHFELLYNHYVVRQRLRAPHVQQFAELRRPEPGEIDVLGHGTLVYTLDAGQSLLTTVLPPVPQDVIATPGLDRVDLKWSPSGAYNAHGYEVSRSISPNGPYSSIYSTSRWTTPAYTDATVKAGRTYYYTVAALNNVGKSDPSRVVSATAVKATRLPEAWAEMDIGLAEPAGRARYSPAAGRTFRVPAGGRDVGGKADDCHVVYTQVKGDFVLTARLIERKGSVHKCGLMIRAGRKADAKTVALMLGEVGGRQCRFFTRAEQGVNMRAQRGNDYTWVPVWFRIQREGSTYIGSQSSDGISWFPVGSGTVEMPDPNFVGLVTAEEERPNQGSAFVVFDNVSLTKTTLVPPSAPSNLIATASGVGKIQLTWKRNAGNTAGFKIEASTDGERFYEIADLTADADSFINTGRSNPSIYSYRARAYNTGGYSDYSNVAAVIALTRE